MNQKILKKKLFKIKYGNLIENTKYWGISILGGIIGAVLVFAFFDLLLMLQNKI